MSSHTPGPWIAEPDTFGDYTIRPHDAQLAVAAVVNGEFNRMGGNTAEHDANARLIAAAPDLLDALRKAEQFIANGVEFGFIRMPDKDTPDSAHDTPPAIRAAITKATGEA